ncbi:PREDICTED: alpha-2,8-sialyltransferase 8B-like [Branchiostoma belcheri]|uniref:Alpha-2,8-sialyltransferase 8B-like n=1 Tax=Branchiostoma belcheri TaxID=7741 RepID=A0A6P4Z4A4_BRABE|nr:PREDICTED: alpha-2,8-sialyltransferase 8B-like [Branchiostoma belcheri]
MRRVIFRPLPLFQAILIFGIGLVAFYIYIQEPELPPPPELPRVKVSVPGLPRPRPLKAVLHHHRHPSSVNQSFVNQRLHSRIKEDAHFNVTNIRKVQKITKKYYDPIRHVIYYSDLEIFMEKCDYLTFTLRDSPQSPCNVAHTPIRHYRTCAVVGSGGILTESGCGAEIDAHEFVIRPNLPPLRRYHRDAGSRTNLTIVNGRRLMKISRALETLLRGKPWVTAMPHLDLNLFESPGMIFSYSFIFTEKRRNEMRVVDTVLKMHNKPTITAFTSTSFLDNRRVYKELAGIEWDFPSTGLNSFALASTFCDRISMYGFYPMPLYQSKRVRYHYFDDHTASESHDFDGEYALLRQLDAMGVIRHVVGKCKPDAPT